MTERLVVVGGDAAGMAAASAARRLRKPADLEIVAFERGTDTSYSACGIPYWIGGDVATPDALIARTAAEHRARGIDLRLATEVTELDLDRTRVRARDLATGTETWVGYDKLVLATGARPIRPPLPGIDAAGVHGVQTLGDGRALLDTLSTMEGKGLGRRARAVVVGAGYIGVEMAEAMVRRGFEVTVLERATQPMSTLDPDMGVLVHEAMVGMGIDSVREAEVTGIETDGNGQVRAVRTARREYPADLVVLGIGVRPETELARAAGLPLGDAGGLLTDRAMRVRGPDGPPGKTLGKSLGNVWAGGDCVEVLDLVSGLTRYIPLGTHANKHGQVIGQNVAGGYATFPGVVGTAVSKVCDLEIGRTGLKESQATAAGFRFVTVTVEATAKAGYLPEAPPMTVKMLAERRTGRLLGCQIVGRGGAAKRVDVAAVALTAGMTVTDMVGLDLGYAPPFSPVWDPVLVAARKAVSAVREAG
jgi:NADPH-dependent 2,4-dienoyl-CoA reductase/sulfur reductase-like enzyme